MSNTALDAAKRHLEERDSVVAALRAERAMLFERITEIDSVLNHFGSSQRLSLRGIHIPSSMASRVVELLSIDPGRIMGATEICAQLGGDVGLASLRATLMRLHRTCRIERVGRGRYRGRPAPEVPQ